MKTITFHKDSILLILRLVPTSQVSHCFLFLIINQHNCTFLDSLLLSIHLPLFSIPHLTLNVHYQIRALKTLYCTDWNLPPHLTCAILCPCSYDYDNYHQPGVVTMNKSSILLAGKYSDEFNSGWTHGHNKVKALHNFF